MENKLNMGNKRTILDQEIHTLFFMQQSFKIISIEKY